MQGSLSRLETQSVAEEAGGFHPLEMKSRASSFEVERSNYGSINPFKSKFERLGSQI